MSRLHVKGASMFHLAALRIPAAPHIEGKANKLYLQVCISPRVQARCCCTSVDVVAAAAAATGDVITQSIRLRLQQTANA